MFKLAKNESEYPPIPKELYTISGNQSEEEDGEPVTVVSGLRQHQELYMDFLKEFGKAVYGREFKTTASAKTLSQFLPTCMEAFLVVAYENGYYKWKQEALAGKTSDDSSSVSTLSSHSTAATNVSRQRRVAGDDVSVVSMANSLDSGFMFTSQSKGSRSCEGWSDEGIAFYDALFDAIEEQREDATLGVAFENQFKIHSMGQSASNGKKPSRSSWDKIHQYEV